MTTQQPIWKYAGHIGDVDPIAYGGGFVYTDETGVYPPELVYFEPASDDDWKEDRGQSKLQVYRIVLDPPRFKTLTETGKRQMIRPLELPLSEKGVTWHWYNEWFVKDLARVSESMGITVFALLRMFLGKNPVARAFAYESLIHYFGAYEFDSYPETITEDQAYEKYAEEMKLARKIA